MHEDIINALFNRYKVDGFLPEAVIYDTLQEEGVSLFDVEYICDQLILRGAIVIDDNKALSEEADEADEYEDLTRTDYDAVFAEIIEMDDGLSSLVSRMKSVLPPQRREWQQLMIQAQNGNAYAQNRIFEMYMRVAARIALQYTKAYDLSIADTLQDAFHGLLTAIGKCDRSKQNHFTSYFPFWVRQSIQRSVVPDWLLFDYPVHIKDVILKVYSYCKKNDLLNQLLSQIEVLPETISEEIDESIKAVKFALDAIDKKMHYSYSTDEALEVDNNDLYDNCSDLGYWGETFDEICNDELYLAVKNTLLTLTAREAQVIKMRYGIGFPKPFTLEEIGATMGVTRERIRQIEGKALRKLRHPSRSKYLKDFY